MGGVTIISALLMSLGFFILYLTKFKFYMFLAFFIMGMGYGCNSVYVRSLIGVGKNINKLSYVQLSVVTNLSAAIGGLLSVCMFAKSFGGYVFLYSAILMLLSSITIFFFLKNEEDIEGGAKMLQAIYFIFTSPGVSRNFVLTILSWIAYAQIFSTLPLLVNNQLNATSFLGSLYATNTVIIVLFSMPVNRFLLKFNIRAVGFIISGFLCITIGFLLIYLVPMTITLYLSMVMWTLGEILIMPALNSSLSELTKGIERLHVFAFNGIAIGVGEGFGMYLGAALAAMCATSQISDIYLYLSIITLFFVCVAYVLNIKLVEI